MSPCQRNRPKAPFDGPSRSGYIIRQWETRQTLLEEREAGSDRAFGQGVEPLPGVGSSSASRTSADRPFAERRQGAMALYDLQSTAFPTLDESQLAEIARCAEGPPRAYRDGDTIIGVGERDFKFLVVKSGEVEIVDHTGDEPKTVVVHG